MSDFVEREQALIAGFREIRKLLEAWGKDVDERLALLLKQMKEEHRLQIGPNARLKQEGSYVTKALYRKAYKQPLVDSEDKVGTRVVLLTTKDVFQVKELIENDGFWRIKLGKDYRDDFEQQPEIFRYQSVHLVVFPIPSEKYPEELVNTLSCEIQVRTILQHAYAEIAHDSSYKGPYRSDTGILRVLAKSMALMETTDDYFCNIYDIMRDQSRKYSNYLNELTNKFRQFVPGYVADPTQIDLNDALLRLLSIKEVPMNELDSYIDSHAMSLRNVINPRNGILFQQPTILLVAFYLENYHKILRDSWPFSHESLENVFQSFGVSFSDY